MRYATVESSDGGTTTDVRPYLEWLGEHVDEMLPHADGVSHELEFTDRTITVVARDLTAGWRGTAGPESPRDPGGGTYLAERGDVVE